MSSEAHAESRFVGGPSLASSEKRGVEHADAEYSSIAGTVLTADRIPRLVPCSNRHGLLANAKPACHDHVARAARCGPRIDEPSCRICWPQRFGILPGDWQNLTATGFPRHDAHAAGDPDVWTPILAA